MSTANAYVDAVVGSDVFIDQPAPAQVKRALVVDDSATTRSILCRMLQGMNVETVRQAGSAAEAYQDLHQERPDLVICDVEMPGTTGLMLLKAMRKTAPFTRIPVIMMTARMDVSYLLTAKEAHADVFLLKPFSADHLRAKVVEAVAHAQHG